MFNDSSFRLSIVVPSISRNGGGFFHSVRNLSRHLYSMKGIELNVLTSENDCPTEDYEAWSPVQPIHCKSYGPYSFRYSPTLASRLDASNADIVHLHGIWQHPSMVTNRWRKRSNRPTLISPRGMLDPWARSRSSYKKRIVEYWFERSNLSGTTCIHSLCEAETKAIRDYGLKQPICEIANGVELPAYPDFSARKKRKKRNLLFLSRIHPKKGLLGLVQAWIGWQLKHKSCTDWRLLIVGWDEIGYLETLKRECDLSGLRYSVFLDADIATKALQNEESTLAPICFIGGAFGETKNRLLSSSDAFILPSHSEGLPISVLEAWSFGLPTLITSQCNLSIGFEKGIAFQIEHSGDSIGKALEEFFCIPIDRQLEIGKSARNLVEQKYTWEIISSEMSHVYRWLLDQSRDKPNSIRIL